MGFNIFDILLTFIIAAVLIGALVLWAKIKKRKGDNSDCFGCLSGCSGCGNTDCAARKQERK